MRSYTKAELLRRHRRKKRLLLVMTLFAVCGLGFFAGIFWAFAGIAFFWIAHEAWFSDHLFYSPAADDRYTLTGMEAVPVTFSDGCLRLATEAGGASALDPDDTLILAARLRATWLGRFLDPAVGIAAVNPSDMAADRQTFERGAKGLRYLNLTGFARALQEGGVRLSGQHCRLPDTFLLWKKGFPDYRQKRLLIVAPHADDAEIAAFGLYSAAKDVWIVTLTAGETEAAHYLRLGISGVEAARLKGRLRAWDSVAVPRWGGVPPDRVWQLGYFCLCLSAMQNAPDESVGSKEADWRDTRLFRAWNARSLASDADGRPTWRNLVADLAEIMRLSKPEVLLVPHPELDPHPDHVAAHAAAMEALRSCGQRVETLLCYANHLHDNDLWPMGGAGDGVALPPRKADTGEEPPYALPLSPALQRDKAMALGMMHDLAPRLSRKKRLRRAVQWLLAGRAPSLFGENEYFRKAVRRHEVFFARSPDF
ncbi:MAG: PIG-L family deacetylase [Zoogloeaceae bacterium]|nr:PIG-L family deacetylase [Zoogloeaceae bacterium]